MRAFRWVAGLTAAVAFVTATVVALSQRERGARAGRGAGRRMVRPRRPCCATTSASARRRRTTWTSAPPASASATRSVFSDRDPGPDRPAGRRPGRRLLSITTALADGFQLHCAGTVSLPGGQLAFQGLVTDAPEKRMAVVGGTGRYRRRRRRAHRPRARRGRGRHATTIRLAHSVELTRPGPGGSGSPGDDPVRDHLGEHAQRQRARAEHRVVERADVEPLAQRPARPRPGSAGSPAGRPCTPAPGRGRRCTGRSPGRSRPSASAVFAPQVVDGLLAAPALRVQAGVDDQPGGPHRVDGQHAEPGDVVGVQAHLVGQPLGVQAPALGVRVSRPSRRSIGRSVSSSARAIWKWCPGTASWNAVASALYRSRSRARWVLAK